MSFFKRSSDVATITPGDVEEAAGFSPLFDWVLVLADSDEYQTQSGLIKPASEDYRPGTGVVVSHGPDATRTVALPADPAAFGTFSFVEPGQRILFSEFAAQKLPTQARPDDRPVIRELRNRLMLVRVRDIQGVYKWGK